MSLIVAIVCLAAVYAAVTAITISIADLPYCHDPESVKVEK